MAQINLTPEGKYQLSRMNKFQGEFNQAILEYSREKVEATFPSSGVANLREWKLDVIQRQILKSGEVSNIEGKIRSFLVPFTDQQNVDPDDISATITAIKLQFDSWFLLIADVNPEDETISGTKDAQTGIFNVV